jgi:hypothetical protein
MFSRIIKAGLSMDQVLVEAISPSYLDGPPLKSQQLQSILSSSGLLIEILSIIRILNEISIKRV